jgi:tetratricopeptide (TPR) repeat protein
MTNREYCKCDRSAGLIREALGLILAILLIGLGCGRSPKQQTGSGRVKGRGEASRANSEAFKLNRQGIYYADISQYEKAFDCFRQAIALARANNLPTREYAGLIDLADAYEERRNETVRGKIDVKADVDSAAKYYRAALALAHSLGDTAREASLLVDVGIFYYRTGNHTTAESLYQAALALGREHGNVEVKARALYHLGLLNGVDLNWTLARQQFDSAATLYRRLGRGTDLVWAEFYVAGMDTLLNLKRTRPRAEYEDFARRHAARLKAEAERYDKLRGDEPLQERKGGE